MDRQLEIINRHASTLPIRIDQLIRDLGLRYLPDAPLPPNISGQLKLLRNGSYEISTAVGEPVTRQRFTAAHELGHYILHRSMISNGVDDDTKYRSTSAGDFYNTRIELAHERQANSFAAQILMPEKLLKEQIKSTKSLRELAQQFNVSPQSMRWRLKNLDLISFVADDVPARAYAF